VIHDHGSQVRFHCHGKIGRVLDMIQATGADAIDPCEPPPDGDISLADVKRKLAGKMCVFGNLELKLLEHASTDEVRTYVKACMDVAKSGGGYVIMPTAAPINTPLSMQTESNYLVFIETALEYGAY
jgi:uroporphyrinogen-III decarboxylase